MEWPRKEELDKCVDWALKHCHVQPHMYICIAGLQIKRQNLRRPQKVRSRNKSLTTGNILSWILRHHFDFSAWCQFMIHIMDGTMVDLMWPKARQLEKKKLIVVSIIGLFHYWDQYVIFSYLCQIWSVIVESSPLDKRQMGIGVTLQWLLRSIGFWNLRLYAAAHIW